MAVWTEMILTSDISFLFHCFTISYHDIAYIMVTNITYSKTQDTAPIPHLLKRKVTLHIKNLPPPSQSWTFKKMPTQNMFKFVHSYHVRWPSPNPFSDDELGTIFITDCGKNDVADLWELQLHITHNTETYRQKQTTGTNKKITK